MKKSKGYSVPCGSVESPAKAKSRIKRFEQHLECNHRLANTYANNAPGDVPSVPQYGRSTGRVNPEASRGRHTNPTPLTEKVGEELRVGYDKVKSWLTGSEPQEPANRPSRRK